MGTLPPKPTSRSTTRFQRAHWRDAINTPFAAYWIVVDAKRVGYVKKVDRDHWSAYRMGGSRICSHPTFRACKTDVAAWLAGKP